MGHKLKYLLSSPLQKSFANPCVDPRQLWACQEEKQADTMGLCSTPKNVTLQNNKKSNLTQMDLSIEL